MKNISTLLMFLSALQITAQSKTFIGIKGGSNISSAYFERTVGNAIINTDLITGYNGGIVIKYFSRVKPSAKLNAGLQTGASLTRKGWRQVFPTEEPDYITRLSYLEFPVEAVIYGGIGKTKPFFTLGFFLEHLVAVEQSQSPDPDNIGSAEFYPYEEGRDRTFGYGIRVSAGLQRTVGFGTVHVEGFGTYSLRDMLNYDAFYSGIPDLSNNYVFGFSVAYMFSFGKLEF